MRSDLPLLIEWSPTRVRVYDPQTGASKYGATLAECEPPRGRDAVVGVSRRSAFIRQITVPATSSATVADVVRFQLNEALPLDPEEVMFGYRLGSTSAGRGRLATAGAVRGESLARIYEEAKALGVRLKAVLPVAFGAWLAARHAGLSDAAVVGIDGETINVDLIRDGELYYSRSVPSADPLGDVQDEIERTFHAAEAEPLPVLAVATPEIPADRHDAKEALEYLGDLSQIDRLLFTLETPARQATRKRRIEQWRAQRATVAALLAICLGAYAYVVQTRKPVATKPTGVTTALSRTNRDRAVVQERLERAERANRVLDVAFRPPQTLGDVVRSISNAASAEAWFTGLTVSRTAPISLTGLALHDRDVTRCLDAVAGDPRFSGMKVVSTVRGVVGKTPVTQFSIAGSPVGTLPYDRPRKEEKKAVKSEPKDR